MPKPTQHQQPVEHYQQAERTLAALASLRIDALPDLAIIEALAALTHAVLATIPARRARYREAGRHAQPPPHATPRDRWLYGDDITDNPQSPKDH
jgi:hypothetical protein